MNNVVLNSLFSKNTFNSIVLKNKDSVFLKELYSNFSDIENNYNLIFKLYKYMSKEYRNEYFYKNTLLNKLLLGRHSLRTTTAISEMPIGNSKADFVMINGKAVVYEIKTELDNLDKLSTQINDYYKVFKFVCVVTSESNYYKILKKFRNSTVGIYVLTAKNTISYRKKPLECDIYLDKKEIFKTLRKVEYENIIKNFYNFLPETTPVRYYDACYELFESIDIKLLYNDVLAQYKKRVNIIEQEFLKEVPYELKSVVYFSNYKVSDYQKLNNFLKKKEG